MSVDTMLTASGTNEAAALLAGCSAVASIMAVFPVAPPYPVAPRAARRPGVGEPLMPRQIIPQK